MTNFRNNVAQKCGINAAIIAEFLWCLLTEEFVDDDDYYRHGYYWCRCSALMMTGELPFLTIHMVKDAVETLVECRIIRKGSFNENRFDRTNWYTFTDYGCRLMEEGDLK